LLEGVEAGLQVLLRDEAEVTDAEDLARELALAAGEDGVVLGAHHLVERTTINALGDEHGCHRV
jgi:hypothetical protein